MQRYLLSRRLADRMCTPQLSNELLLQIERLSRFFLLPQQRADLPCSLFDPRIQLSDLVVLSLYRKFSLRALLLGIVDPRRELGSLRLSAVSQLLLRGVEILNLLSQVGDLVVLARYRFLGGGLPFG